MSQIWASGGPNFCLGHVAFTKQWATRTDEVLTLIANTLFVFDANVSISLRFSDQIRSGWRGGGCLVTSSPCAGERAMV